MSVKIINKDLYDDSGKYGSLVLTKHTFFCEQMMMSVLRGIEDIMLHIHTFHTVYKYLYSITIIMS